MIAGLEDLLSAASHVQKFLTRQGCRFCFIGGVAVQRWATPRFTQDIDLTLLTGFGLEEHFVDLLLSELKPRRPDSREFALTHRVLLAQTGGGVEVDVALGALPFEERTVLRATEWQSLKEAVLTTCSAEDLIVHKVFAGRDLDWGDVERVLIRQHGKLNLTQIQSELKPLLDLKGETDALDKLDRMLRTVERRLGTNR
jgi:hypothetical protein